MKAERLKNSAPIVRTRALLATLMLWTSVALPSVAHAAEETEGSDVLVARYACLIGGREPGTAPTLSGVLSGRELSDFLLEWQPGADNEEMREIFALNDLGELARQASQLSLDGGVVSGVYHHDGARFDIELQIQRAEEEDTVTVHATVRREGELLSRPTIRTRLGDRAIVTTTNGPEAPFLFLVVEVDRVSPEELRRRGLRHSWRKDYYLVDGEEVVAPVVLEKAAPTYTEEARAVRQEGKVVVRAIIDTDGLVEDVEVIEGLPYGLTEQAVAAIRQWRFQPALRDGKPVAVFYLLTINFRLQ